MITTPATVLAQSGNKLPCRRASRFAFQLTLAILLGVAYALQGGAFGMRLMADFSMQRNTLPLSPLILNHRAEPV